MRRAGPHRTGLGSALALLVVLGALATACGGSKEPSAPPSGSTAVSFASADGVTLEGRLFGGGEIGVVLSHMLPADQTSWWGFADQLAGEGYLVLTYDFRGYCPGGDAGCSKGEKNIDAIWQDVLGAIDFIRSQGAQRVVLAGASMGGTASLVAAAQPGVDVGAVVTLSAPTSIEGLTADAEVLTHVAVAKLFIAGAGDGQAADSAQTLYDQSPPPKRLEILATGDHGTDILDGNQSGPARSLIIDFLAQRSEEP
jgi:pimeloyl-ACP methyl ester carboxylesterase